MSSERLDIASARDGGDAEKDQRKIGKGIVELEYLDMFAVGDKKILGVATILFGKPRKNVRMLDSHAFAVLSAGDNWGMSNVKRALAAGRKISFVAELEIWAEGMDYCAVAVPM